MSDSVDFISKKFTHQLEKEYNRGYKDGIKNRKKSVVEAIQSAYEDGYRNAELSTLCHIKKLIERIEKKKLMKK